MPNITEIHPPRAELVDNKGYISPPWYEFFTRIRRTLTGEALTRVNDTNVTLTLGGTPTEALLAATSITVGWSGQLGPTRGGTGLATVTQGDLIYGSAANTWAALAKNTTATRYLSNTGASNNPAWAQIDLTNGVTGILPAANGGTSNGFTAFTGPATSTKTFTLPNASETIACLGQAQTFTAQQNIAGGVLQSGAVVVRIENTFPTAPSGAAGAGMELGINTGQGLIQNYNRTTSAYIPMLIDASQIDLRFETTSVVTITSTGVVLSQPLRLPSYTVATLPASGDGTLAFASDGRKTGEGAGAGTGLVVYRDGGAWYRFADDSAVAA